MSFSVSSFVNQSDSELWNFNNSVWYNSTANTTNNSQMDPIFTSYDPPASTLTIILLSTLFFTIGFVGIVGNLLVIFVILTDKKMRQSVINVLIMNLAVSDLIIMVVCVPEIIQFMLNMGWRLGLFWCCIIRFTQVFSLYSSVMTLVTICVERYIAILHPIHANIICCPRRIRFVIFAIWPVAISLAAPNLLFHFLESVTPEFIYCRIEYPNPNDMIIFKYSEFILFYLIPLMIQIVLYIRIGRCLFTNTPKSDKDAEKLRARRGVVKMLIAGVVMYFVCFSPVQALLFYNTLIGPDNIKSTWEILVFVNIMAYMSSASNPLLYSIFSLKFRRKFGHFLSCSTASSFAQEKSLTRGMSLSNSRHYVFRVRSFKTTETSM